MFHADTAFDERFAHGLCIDERHQLESVQEYRLSDRKDE